MTKLAAIIAVATLPIAGWAQETITLRDGTQFHGRIVGADDRSISFRSRDGDTRQVDKDRIDFIRFDHERPGNAPPPVSNNYNQNNSYNQSNGYNNGTPYTAGNPNTAYMTLPAGTAIAIRTNESIRTHDTDGGRTYDSQVDQDVVTPDGQVLIPRGSSARLVVRRTGEGNLALDLQSVMLNGQSYTVNTNDIVEANRRDGVGANRRTAEYAGGGAALGTLLGAIAGGGKGAAIGALAGGAAGAGTETLTRGSEVHVPAETVLSFRLDSPVTLMPAPRQ